MGAGDKKGFGQFLSALGLGEKKEEPTEEQKKAMIDKSNAIAERILKQVQKRAKKHA
jgi:hypothetical protein